MEAPPVVTPNAFERTDVERINLAIRSAAGTGRRVGPAMDRQNENRVLRTSTFLALSAGLLCFSLEYGAAN